MHVEGEVPLEIVVWLTHSPEAAAAFSLARAMPKAEWLVTAIDRARLRLRGTQVDVEPLIGRHWTGLVQGRVEISEEPPIGSGFKPYVLEAPAPPLLLQSCWFALDLEGRVACFDRELLGAAPMRRCWGPRHPAPATDPEPETLVSAITGHHAPAREPARAYSFVADAGVLARELASMAPQAAARRWSLMVAEGGSAVIVSAGRGTASTEPVSASFVAWLHARGICRGCVRSSLRDLRVVGAYVYQCQGRDRAAPYERVSEPYEPWTAEQAAEAIGLSLEALEKTVLPVRFATKDRLQPIEYVPCTWSETVPWESEAGEHHGDARFARSRGGNSANSS